MLSLASCFRRESEGLATKEVGPSPSIHPQRKISFVTETLVREKCKSIFLFYCLYSIIKDPPCTSSLRSALGCAQNLRTASERNYTPSQSYTAGLKSAIVDNHPT